MSIFMFFFFIDPATTEIYTLSLHDALPICLEPLLHGRLRVRHPDRELVLLAAHDSRRTRDRKSTRLNSSHMSISYAVFCLKKKRHIDEGPCIRPFIHPIKTLHMQGSSPKRL